MLSYVVGSYRIIVQLMFVTHACKVEKYLFGFKVKCFHAIFFLQHLHNNSSFKNNNSYADAYDTSPSPTGSSLHCLNLIVQNINKNSTLINSCNGSISTNHTRAHSYSTSNNATSSSNSSSNNLALKNVTSAHVKSAAVELATSSSHTSLNATFKQKCTTT
uniref:Uncharacterized protein n=1 Tax=Glossina palpalis gambiensis TaxID=67801 RepID=A0A1B0AVC5_9MUSC